MAVTPNERGSNINNLVDTKPKRNAFGASIWYISFILLIPLFVHIANINKLKRLNMKVSEAESGIDVQLKKRRDLLIKLIDSVKGSIKFEKDALISLTAMRTGVGIQTTGANAAMLDKMSKQVTMQIENYPNLKSQETIKEMMSQTKDMEDDIAAARRIYNSNASIFNQKINQYPINAAAAQLGYKFKPMFETTEEEREDIKIEF